MNVIPRFEPSPKARANLRFGTVYAIDGDDSFIYYGQVAADKSIGFFKYRSGLLSSADAVIESPLMSRFGVNYRSIGEALRSGVWMNLGLRPLRTELVESPITVQWPVGTLEVTLWKGRTEIRTTKVHDPEIQNLEVIASYDAIYHVPARLKADFEDGVDSWAVGGLIWRERMKKEQWAARFPEQPWQALPPDWVPVEFSQSNSALHTGALGAGELDR